MFIPYRPVNTLRLDYKIKQLMMYREITAFCYEIRTNYLNAPSGQNVEFFSVKPGGS